LQAVRKWVLYSTLFGVFGSRFLVIVGGLTLFYFYFIILINIVLLAFMGFLWAPAKLRWFLAYLFCSGSLGLLLGTNSSAGFIKSFLGIAICAVYSAAFLRLFRFDAVGLFRRYAEFAFYAACFGLVALPFHFDSQVRLAGLFLEPSAFCIVCMPAVFYYADEWQRNRRNGIRLITLCVAYLLTLSSLGYLGMMMGGLLFGRRYRVGRVLVPVFLTAAAVFTYRQSDMFQARFDDTLSGLTLGDVSGINESSYGIVANVFVTQRQFEEHPFLGGGLGSHIVAHERFIEEVPGAAYLPEQLRDLGEWDASSLFLRISSELGLLGIALAFWFLWRYYPRGASPEEQSIALGLLCYVFMKLVRSGEYFGGEQFFFLAIYAVLGMKARTQAQLARREGASTIAIAYRPAPLPGTASPAESH